VRASSSGEFPTSKITTNKNNPTQEPDLAELLARSGPKIFNKEKNMLNNEKQTKSIGIGIALGTALGAVAGQVLFDNLALGIGLGISLGAALGAFLDKRS
jgi:hypothetical protein